MANVLLFSALVVAVCGLIYELTAATIASYLLGDSVTQFSTVIGVYLFGMGVGSYLSRFVRQRLVETFIKIELLIAATGGCSGALLFFCFAFGSSFRVLLYTVVVIVGIGVGLEIPLLMRILKDRMEFRDVISKVLSFDYVGALLASVLFPILFVPHLGLLRTSFFFGICNSLVACWMLYLFQDKIVRPRWNGFLCALVTGMLVIGFAWSDSLLDLTEAEMYPAPVIYSKSTPYQRLVITKRDEDLRLYLNGNLQFSSLDEYRYHESLVHVGLSSVIHRQRVLILGGGDGMAAREVLKYPDVESITLVDLDPAMTALFRDSDLLSELNNGSLRSEKLTVVNADAFTWLRTAQQQFDFVVVDFPDPSNFSVGKLYTDYFYKQLSGVLAPGGVVAIQATSPLYARRSFWCLVETLQASGFSTMPYHVYVPSFTEWGFVLASSAPVRLGDKYPGGLRFLNPDTVKQLTYFPPDMAQIEADVNKLSTQVLVKYYDEEWSKYQ